MTNKIILLMSLLLLCSSNCFADYCLATETRINRKTGKIYEITKKYEFKFFSKLSDAESFANKRGLQDNIFKDQDYGYRVFLKRPKGTISCIYFSID